MFLPLISNAQTCVFVYDLFSFLYNPDSVRFSAKVFTESAIQYSPGFGLWKSVFALLIIIVKIRSVYAFLLDLKSEYLVRIMHFLGGILGWMEKNLM